MHSLCSAVVKCMDKSQCCYQFLFSIEIDARELYLYLRIHVPIIRTCTKFESNRITFTPSSRSLKM